MNKPQNTGIHIYADGKGIKEIVVRYRSDGKTEGFALLRRLRLTLSVLDSAVRDEPKGGCR